MGTSTSSVENMLFSDESKINLKFSDGRVLIYHRRRERIAAGFVKETNQFGGGGVMVCELVMLEIIILK